MDAAPISGSQKSSSLGRFWLRYVRPSITLWLAAFGFSVAATIFIGKFAPDLKLDANSLASILGDILAFLGVLTAVLIAVFTAIHVRAREATESGFRMVREAVDSLDILGDTMRQNVSRGSREYEVHLIWWANSTKALVVRLNEIHPTWTGWMAEKFLETELLAASVAPSDVANETGVILHTDPFWSGAVTEYNHRLRGALIGLYQMNEGALGNQLARDLRRVFSHLVVVLVFGLVLRVLASLGHGDGAPDLINFFFLLSIVAASVLLLGMMLLAVNNWWTGIGQQEAHW